MSKRHKMGGRRSRRLFSKTADFVHKKNGLGGGASYVMRGGIRL